MMASVCRLLGALWGQNRVRWLCPEQKSSPLDLCGLWVFGT